MNKWIKILFNERGEADGGDMNLAQTISDAPEPAVEGAPANETPAKAPEPKAEVKPDDQEFELDYEETPGQKARAKLADLKAQAKWFNDNKNLISGSLKIRETATQNPKFGQALNTLIKSSFDEKGGYLEQNVEAILQKLEAKEAVIEKKVENADDNITKMEKMLEDLDPESPHYQILQNNINSVKAVKVQLSQALDQNKKFQERLDGLDQFKTGLIAEKDSAVRGEKVKQLSDLYEKEIGALSDPAKKDGFKFVDESEKADFDRALRDAIAQKAGAIKSDEEFAKTVQDTARAMYDGINKRREAWIADYHRRKGINPVTPTKLDEKPKEGRSFEDMGALLGDAIMTPPK